jgi:hypothetical protein
VTTLERLTKAVPPPSSQNPLVPRALDPVVLACLQRSVDDRLQTALAVLARLEELERHVSTPKPKRRSGVMLAVAGLVSGVSALALLTAGRGAPPLVPAVASERPLSVVEPPAAPAARPADSSDPPVAALPKTPSAAPSAAKLKERSRLVTSELATRVKRPVTPPGRGWENPFGPQPSADLGAVQNQPLDGRPSPGDSELPESGR